MRVLIPAKYKVLVDKFKRPFFNTKKAEGGCEISMFVEFSVHRLTLGLTPKEFAVFSREVKVFEGYKRKRGNYLILSPKRNKVVRIRIAEEALDLIKKEAERRRVSLSAYIMNAALNKALIDSGILHEGELHEVH